MCVYVYICKYKYLETYSSILEAAIAETFGGLLHRAPWLCEDEYHKASSLRPHTLVAYGLKLQVYEALSSCIALQGSVKTSSIRPRIH